MSEKETPWNAQKSVRKVEIGWLNFCDGKFLQVRTKKDGGTRKICVKGQLQKRAN